MRIAGAAAGGAIMIGLAAACGPPAIASAPASQASLRMLVTEADVMSSDRECNDGELRRIFSNEMKSALLTAGYSVAAPGTPFDVKWTLHVNVTKCLDQGDHRALTGFVDVSADAPDGTLFTGQSKPEGLGNAPLQGSWAPSLVNQFTRTSAVAEYAKKRPASAAVAEVASAPPTPRSSPPPAPPSPKLRTGATRGNAYALVVGIETYRDVPSPTGARADAQHFADLAKTTLGVPADHVHLAVDDRATKADIEREIAWLGAEAPAGSRIYFFFAGHGAPDAAEGTPYLLPYDGDPKYVTTSALPLARVLEALGKTKADDVIAFVDACFSGAGGRSVLAPGARPLVRVRETAAAGAGSKIALLASAAGNEISGPTRAGGEGLFTHVLLEAIGSGAADIDGDGNLSLAEIATWIKPRVTREASQDHREQTPTLSAGAGLGDPSRVIVAGGLSP